MGAPPRLPQSHIRIHATEDPSTRTRTPHAAPWGTPQGHHTKKKNPVTKGPTPCDSMHATCPERANFWSQLVSGWQGREGRGLSTCFPLRRLEQQTPTCSQFWKLEVSEIEVSTGGVTGRTRGWLADRRPLPASSCDRG